MRTCGACGGSVGKDFRYCPWCAAPLRLKLVEFFRGDDEHSPERSLRVSRYLGDQPHVRFSVWHDTDREAKAEAVVSLTDAEAARLARFLDDSTPPVRPRTFLERVYDWTYGASRSRTHAPSSRR